MSSSAGGSSLALHTDRRESSDDRPTCLENPRPEGAESTLTDNAVSPFQAEPAHNVAGRNNGGSLSRWTHASDSLNSLLFGKAAPIFSNHPHFLAAKTSVLVCHAEERVGFSVCSEFCVRYSVWEK